MAKYIDADKLIEELQTAKNAEWNKHDHSKSLSEMIEDFCTELKNAPAADVIPRSWVEGWDMELAKEIFAEIDKITCRYLGDKEYSTGEMIYDLDALKEEYITEEL